MQRKLYSGQVIADATLGPRQIRVVANSGKSDRVKDVLVAKGCQLDNYLSNPIVLADHDPAKPIGNFAPEIKGDRVEGIITFAPEGISAKADEYCGLYKSGVMKTVSVGFNALDHERLDGGGYLYKTWELMELSCVAVPCDPNALVIGRSFPGAETKAAKWKCGASRTLPIDEDSDWDGPAAEKSIFEACGFDGDKPDTNKARKAFLAYDSAKPTAKGSYKLPFAKMVDGRMTAVAAGLRAAASRLPQADIPDDVREKGRAVLDEYESRMKEGKGTPMPQTKTAPHKIKGLYEVACLADLLARLGWAQDAAVWESAIEEDNSKVPGMLAEALHSLADAFLAMTEEEVEELLEGRDVELAPADAILFAGLPDRTKRVCAAFRKAALNRAAADHLDEAQKCMSKAYDLAQTARDLEHHVKAAEEHITSAQDADSDDVAASHMEEASKSAAAASTIAKSMRPLEHHIAKASDHIKAVRPAGKPDDHQDEDHDQDQELAFEAAHRKRMSEVLALGNIP